MGKEEINSKDHLEYIDHQKIKTTDPVKIKKWQNEEWQIKLEGFKEIFSQYSTLFKKEGKCLGLGSRTGQEIAALNELGYQDAIGVDIVPFPPYTIAADFHELPFDKQSASLIYSNAVDHVRIPSLWSSEINRVLKPGGYCLFNLQIGLSIEDEYTVFVIEDVEKDLLPLFRNYTVIENKQIPMNVHSLNWEVLIQKK